jgi:tartrate dehydratase beta subunit/fumarate hydratase class I family protein
LIAGGVAAYLVAEVVKAARIIAFKDIGMEAIASLWCRFCL